MIIFPAIDLRNGRCVRLRQGKAEYETVFAEDAVSMARRWVDQGASWLHVVDLDAALGQGANNQRVVKSIAASAGVPVQLGGGLRTMEAIKTAFTLGVARVVIGTAAVRNPQMVRDVVARFGAAAVAVGIDSRNGKVTVQGWQETTEVDVLTLALRMKTLGVERIICTDVVRDGMLSGPNITLLRHLVEGSGLRIIASGGVATLDDLRSLAAIPGMEGAIVGQTLYTGAFTLADALKAVRDSTQRG